MPRRYLFLLLALVMVACSEEPAKDKRVQNIEQPAEQLDVDFSTRILPLLEKRCVHCHACYDAPCQLKLSSREGIGRGALGDKIYDGTRLLAAEQTRLYIDAHSSRQWREKGFHSILPELEGAQSPVAQANLLAQVLQHKQDHPLPLTDDGRLQDVFDLTLNRAWHCPLEADYAEYAEDKPYAGMPFALPALSDGETTLIRSWLEAGAPMPQASLALGQYRGVDKTLGNFPESGFAAGTTGCQVYI